MTSLTNFNGWLRFVAIALTAIAASSCTKSDSEKQVADYLAHHYEGEFRVIDKTSRGAKDWFVVEHDGRMFKIAVASVPPHQVIEDRFPDLVVGRSFEAAADPTFHPVVDVKLAGKDREAVRDSGERTVVTAESVTLYMSVAGEPSKGLEDRMMAEASKVAKAVGTEIEWEARFYDDTADPSDLFYRTVVALGWMEQSAENVPQPEKVRARISGAATGDEATIRMR